jgi:MYXO-CTERM domain-containing protein
VGCSCDVTDEQNAPLAWFGLLGLLAIRRRRQSR